MTPIGRRRRDLAGQAGPIDHVDHEIDVLIRRRLLLGQPLPTSAAGQDAPLGQFAVDAAALGILDRGGAAHHPARPVAGRAEGLLHAARHPQQHPTARPMSPGMITGWPMVR